MALPTGIDLEAEKKKNVRIAIGIAAAGILGGMLLYFMIFAMMFLSPFSFFMLIPFPDIQTDVALLNEKILVFSKVVDFRGASFKKEPKEKTIMRKYDETFTEPLEVEPFHSLSEGDGKVYFFDEGLYRVFDGAEWEEVMMSSIGTSPKGAVSPKGLVVLSMHKDKAVLNLIDGEMVEELPLPEEDITLCSSQPILFGNELYMFWKKDGNLIHSTYRDGQWDAVESFKDPGDYNVIVKGPRMLMFWRVPQEGIIMRSFERGIWSDPEALGIGSDELIVDYHPLVFQDKIAVLTSNIFSKNLYFIDDGIKERQHLWSPFSGRLVLGLSLLIIIPIIIAALFVLALSAVINKYKLRFWKFDGRFVESASLFRRFLAHAVDTVATSLPMLLFIPLFIKGIRDENPFLLFGIIFLGFIGYMIGVLLYYSFLEGIWGKTIGKRLVGIVVLREDFTKCTLGRAFLRNILRVVDYMFYYLAGLVTIGATLKWQRLGDLAAGTVVVMDTKS
jgi:uncharacterized RDD family membrane protein YckC